MRNCILLMLFAMGLATVAPTAARAAEDAATYKFKIPAESRWFFGSPYGVDFDSSDNMYVADAQGYGVQKIAPDGSTLIFGEGAGILNYVDVGVDSVGGVYVVNNSEHCIQKFASDGTFLMQWGGRGTGDGKFLHPRSVAVDSRDSANIAVYVVDGQNCRVQKFTSDGVLLGWWGRDDLGLSGWHAPGSGRTGRPGTGNGEFTDVDGVAVDSLGAVYVVSGGWYPRVQKFTPDGTFVTFWGALGSEDGYFWSPQSVVVDPSGLVYVADTGNNRIQAFSSADGVNYAFVRKWGNHSHVGSDGVFEYPRGLALDSSGNVYVCGNGHVQEFTPTGTFLRKWGPSLDGQLLGPCGVAVDPLGYIYVADTKNFRIQRFDSAGTFLTKWGTHWTWPPSDGQFVQPYDLAVDALGNCYVVDQSSRIQKFSSDGTFLSSWGSYGTGDGQFWGEAGIALDAEGLVYVVDSMNHRIQKFSSDGAFLAKYEVGAAGSGGFWGARDVAVDSEGAMYVTFPSDHCVHKLASGGAFMMQWGVYGHGDGEFDRPAGVAVDPFGHVYVGDHLNNRVQIFTSGGVFVGKVGGGGAGWQGSGSGDGELSGPLGVAVGLGNIYVADTNNNRVQVFRLPNEAPTLEVTVDQTAYLGAPFSLQLNGSDPNNDPLTYSAVGLPPGLAIDSVTGLISGTPTTYGIWLVTAAVSDGSLSDSKSFSIMVPNTLVGTNVTVDAGEGTLVTFSSVTAPGITTSVCRVTRSLPRVFPN